MDDPSYLIKRDSIASLIKFKHREYCVGIKDDILKFINYFYGTDDQNTSVSEIIANYEAKEHEEVEDQGEYDNDSAITQLVNKTIIDACIRGASDIHIEPHPGKQPVQIRFRLDGECMVYQNVP